MIKWFTGNSGSGKTTMANRINDKQTIHLDGDELRDVWTLGFSKDDRWEQNIRVAKLAKLLEGQGFKVIVSTICPYKNLRRDVKVITGCEFIYLDGGKESSDEYPYE